MSISSDNRSGTLVNGCDIGPAAQCPGSNLAGEDLTGTDLTGADLHDAKLTGANLTGADLGGANLANAEITGANLTDTNLADATLPYLVSGGITGSLTRLSNGSAYISAGSGITVTTSSKGGITISATGGGGGGLGNPLPSFFQGASGNFSGSLTALGLGWALSGSWT